ncbi:MAG: tetratricopeptide repeat protein [Planctomycetes bacterium]|nr:tetratricopeptide repeat protein [Planctomycetota bacterium]
MSIILECLWCNKQFALKDETMASQKHFCPECRSELAVIKKESLPKEEPRQEKMPASVTEAPEDVRKAFGDKKAIISGKYIVLKKLGQGGMGAVFSAWDLSLKRYVALKMILPSQTEDSGSKNEFVKRFIHEAQTAARLIHQNIVQIYEVGRHENNHFICMEYVDSGTLEDYWQKKQSAGNKKPSGYEKTRFRLPDKENITEYLMLMKDVIKAMDYAHMNNIIHRDIKPENILLAAVKSKDAQGKPQSTQSLPFIPKVSDFGLAKEASEKKHLTVAGTAVGTPVYMSPEQANALKTDNRSDIFSLGSVLYRLCTGTEPFRGKSPLDVMKAVVNKEPIPPSALNKAVKKNLEVIILKALEKEKIRRYATAGELADDIENFLNGEPINARPASTLHKITKTVKRNRAAFSGIGIAAFILIVMSLWMYSKSAGTERTAREYLAKANGFYDKQNWKEAREFYAKYLALKKDDSFAQDRSEECGSNMEKQEQAARQLAEEQEKKAKAIEADREKERKATEEVQQAWFFYENASKGFYRKNADMDKVWKEIDDARKMLDNILSKYPLPQGYLYRAMIWREKGRLEDAEKDLSKAIELKPDYGLAFLMRGVVYTDQYVEKILRNSLTKSKQQSERLIRNLEIKAMLDFESFAETRSKLTIPEQFKIYQNIFDAMRFYQNDSEKTISMLEKDFDENNSEETAYLLAVLHLLQDNTDKSAKYIEKTLEIKPMHAKAYAQMGRIETELDNTEKALEHYSRAIQLNPNLESAYNNRALLELNGKDTSAALRDINAAILLNPNEPLYYCNRAAIKNFKGDMDGALEDCETAIKTDPDYAPAYSARGVCKLNKKDTDGAIEDLTKAIQINPEDANFYVYRGSAQCRKEYWNEAIEDFTKALKLVPDSVEAYYNRGAAKQETKDFNGALSDYDTAIRLKPGYGKMHADRGMVKFQLNDFNGAIEDLNDAIALGLDNEAQIYFNRGGIKYGQKDIDGAVEDMTAAINADPEYAAAYDARGRILFNMNKHAEALQDMKKPSSLIPHWDRN